MKAASKTLLTAYLVVLLWLVLFKFSMHPGSVIADYQIRNVNLIPFAGATKGNPLEMVYNVIAFIPLGLLLAVNFNKTDFRRKLLFILLLSISVEITQYVLAIGRTDITDVITNTFGGYIGLVLYALGQKYIAKEKLNGFIIVVGTVLIILFLIFRFLVLRVRYQSH
jgi:glycopeptide antibiotics resistance protein